MSCVCSFGTQRRSSGSRQRQVSGPRTSSSATSPSGPRWSRALDGCDGVLHAAGAVSLDRARAAEVMAVNQAAARFVLRLAAEQGLRPHRSRLEHNRTVRDPGLPLTVDAPVATGGGYARSKAAAEGIARELRAAGAPVLITYPSGVLGPAAGESLGETSVSMARFVAAGVMPTPRGAISVVDVRDLAEVHRLLLEPGERPDRGVAGPSSRCASWAGTSPC